MKILIIGGHLSPALAVIEALPKDHKVMYVGRKHALEGDRAESLEYKKIKSLNIEFENLETGRLQRRLTKYTLLSLLKMPKGLFRSFYILKKFKPDIVVGFGGYLQLPICMAAFILDIPIILHEQTPGAGLANKIVAKIANTICVSWEESKDFFPKDKTIVTGLPIRKVYLNAKKERNSKSFSVKKKLPMIYITGGSLGAHAINVLIEGVIEKLLTKFRIVHQTGEAQEFKDFERLGRIRDDLVDEIKNRYKLVKFIDPEESADIMASADLIISRSGINTVAELIYLRKSCLLIPLPHGQHNEQKENAKLASKAGLGKILDQDNLTAEILYSQIVEFTAKLDNTRDYNHAKQEDKEEASRKIIEVIQKTCKEKN